VLDCGSIDCTLQQVQDITARVVPTFPEGVSAAGLMLFAFADHAVAFACADDMGSCISLVPTCSVALDGLKTCRV
jgi:hypothetical protein